MEKVLSEKKYLFAVVIFALLFLIFIATGVNAVVLGPGWFMGTADPVSPEAAMAYFNSKQGRTGVQGTVGVTGVASFAASATVISDEIKELARGLQYDPKLIYDYVHNHIDYVPYFGSLKGATLTYLDGSGNDFDQASLMIALLTESKTYNAGIGAIQYVYGTMTALRSKLVEYSTNLTSFLRTNYPNSEMSEILGDRKIVTEITEQYPAGLRFPYTITASWDSIPDTYVHKVHIQHGQIDQLLSIHDIAGKRLAITYDTGGSGAGAPVRATSLDPHTTSAEVSGLPLPVQGQSAALPASTTLPLTEEPFLTSETVTISSGEIVPPRTRDSGTVTTQSFQGSIDFGSVNSSGSSTWPPTWTNSCSNPTLYVNSWLSNNSNGAYSIISGGGYRTVAPCGSFTIEVRFSGSGQSRGTKTATFNLETWYSGYSHNTDTWTLTGFVAESPNLSGSYGVSMLAYLNQPLDNTARLKNSGSQTLTITGMSLTGSNPNMFQIISGGGTGNISAGSYRDIVVRYLATTRGTHTANIHIVFNYDGISGYQIDLPLSGQTVYAPDFTGSYGISFGQRYLNDFTQGTAILKNSGTLSLTINSISLVGTDSSRFQILSGGGSGTLSSGQSRNIDVKYLANAVGVHNADIRVSFTYDGISNTIDLPLTGETVSAPAAQLWLDDELIAVETPPVSGAGLAQMTLTIDHPYADDSGTYGDQTSTYNLKRGSSYVIISDFGGSEKGQHLKKRQRILEDYRTGGLSDASKEVLTETLNVMGQTWMQQTTLSDNLLARLSNVIGIRHHRFGIMAQEQGYYVDVKTQVNSYISRNNITADENACFKAGSFLGSALEHGVLEQLQGVDRPAASTIKLIHLANSQGSKIFLANSANFSGIQTQLTGYSTQDLQDFQSAVNSGVTLVLPANGQIALLQWRGKGYVKYSQDVSGKAELGMIIGGDYYGGYGAYPLQTCTYCVQNEFGSELLFPSHISTAQCGDPVDMTTGAYVLDQEDIGLGGEEPLGLHFKRYYNSDNHNEKSNLGYGWTHSYNIYVNTHSDVDSGLAMRQPVDAVASLVASVVTLDLMSSSMPTVKEWTTAALTGKWQMDELFENAVSVHLQDKVLTYIMLPDGTYSSPPGVTTGLVKQTGLYQLQERFGTRINFNSDNKISSWVDVDGNTMTFTYSGNDLITVRDAFNRSLTLGYPGGKLTSVTDSAGRFVSYGYTIDDLTGYADPESKVWSYGYDGSHRMTTQATPMSITTVTNVYDSLGRVKEQTEPRQGTSTIHKYYFSGYRNIREESGSQTIYFIDDKRRTVAEKDALENLKTTQYDGQNHVVETVDAKGNQAWFYYDGNHNLTTTINALGLFTDYVYDAQFRLTDTVDHVFHGSHVEYDSEHHPALSRYGVLYDANLLPTDNGLSQTTASYYANGLTQTTTDGRSAVTTLTYDSYGNPQTTKVGAHPVLTTNYYPIGIMYSLTDQVGSTTNFNEYNNRLQLKLKTDPLGKTTSFTYDDAGRLLYKIDRKGHMIDYAYTPTDKVERVTYPDTSTVNYTYDQYDQLTVMQDSIGNTGYAYDTIGRLTSSTFTYSLNPASFSVSYEYDANGNMTKLIYTGNKSVSYTYDELNRLETVKIDWLNQTATYYYDDAGRLYFVMNFNGTVTIYGYDNANRLISLENKKSDATTLASYSFTLDGNGNRTQVVQNEPLVQILSPENASYTYNDKKNRLLAANTASFGYDFEGQLSTAYGSTYSFDYEHRLTGIGSNTQFFYDGKGNRVQAVRDGVTTRYIYDASGNLLAEADGSNNITSYYIYGAGLLARVTPANQVYTYHFNAVGSTIAMSNSSQAVVNKYAYDPFGKILNQVEAIPQPLKFVGQHGVMTEPNGMYYMRARYYDPEVGRFISEDPIGFEGGDTNLMAYVGNNPILLIDSEGLAEWLRKQGDPAVMGSVNAPADVLKPGSSLMEFFEYNVPNFYETSIQHDAMLNNLGVKNAYGDSLSTTVNIITMPIAFKNALDANIYETIVHPIDTMKPVYNKIMNMCK
ncbi:MAG: choice-of-anchor D domain-containing protein [Nitrospirae bacterium]|nr:choice-of-anchor D domain-containing protein [Nitrospirota bacterium]